MCHSSLYQLNVSSVPYLRLTKFHLRHFLHTNQTFPILKLRFHLFLGKFVSATTLQAFLSSDRINLSPKNFRTPITPYQNKYVPTSTTQTPYSSDQQNVISIPVTTLSISSNKTSGRAASVTCSILPYNSVDSSVNSSNSFYVVRFKPLSFKTTKSLVPKSLAPFETSVCIESSVTGVVS